jgi:hypothetical protein
VTEHEEVIRTSRGATRRWVILLEVPGANGVRFGAALSPARRRFVVAMLAGAIGRRT